MLNVIRKLVREFARQSPKEPMPSAIVKAAYMRVVPETYRRVLETQVDVDKVETHNLEDKVLAFIRNNTSGAAPMDIGNIAPGQTPTPGLGSSSQSTTSSSHGGLDSYPDLNNCEYAAQWGQDWNTGDADSFGSSDGELYGLQKGKGKGKSGSFNGICYNFGKSDHSAKFCYAKGGKAKGKGNKGDSKGWTVGKGWSEGKGWNTSGTGWEQQRPVGMNNLERDSKQYDVLVMETSTLEKTVRDSDGCVPVKHVAKLGRMRGSTSTNTNIKFFVDPEEEDRDNDTTSDCLGSKQFSLKDDVSYKCSRSLTTKRTSVRFSSLTDADINFFENGNTDLCELQQNTWAPLPKPLVVDSGAGETVMPVDWLTSHPLTESDGQEQMISTQQPMAAVCTMKDKENWMFAHLTANSEDP